MRIFYNCGNYEGIGAWHLQDDIIICRDFREETEKYDEGIVCGFGWGGDENIDYTGLVKSENMRWSFPCTFIPHKIARECADWFFNKAQHEPKYKLMVKEKKFDDYFFKEFVKIHYPNYEPIYNLEYSLVDHVDFLIGGSIVNAKRAAKQTRAKFFKDQDLVDNLEKKLTGRK